MNASLVYEDSDGTRDLLEIADLLVDVATKRIARTKVSVGTAEEAIPLGEATSPGWAFFKNHDTTNFVNLKTATGGIVFGKLLPGEVAMLRLGSGAQAPFWAADTAACVCEALIVMT